MNKFKDRLNELLFEKNMSQTALAKKIFVSISIVNRYCKGKIMPSYDVLISICKELDVSVDYLLGIED